MALFVDDADDIVDGIHHTEMLREADSRDSGDKHGWNACCKSCTIDRSNPIAHTMRRIPRDEKTRVATGMRVMVG